MQIDTVEQRTGNPCLIIATTGRCAGTGPLLITQKATSAGIHRRDKLEPGRIGDMHIGPGHRNAAGFHRLTQRLQRGALKLRQLVEKQHPTMSQRCLPRPDLQPATYQRRQ